MEAPSVREVADMIIAEFSSARQNEGASVSGVSGDTSGSFGVPGAYVPLGSSSQQARRAESFDFVDSGAVGTNLFVVVAMHAPESGQRIFHFDLAASDDDVRAVSNSVSSAVFIAARPGAELGDAVEVSPGATLVPMSTSE